MAPPNEIQDHAEKNAPPPPHDDAGAYHTHRKWGGVPTTHPTPIICNRDPRWGLATPPTGPLCAGVVHSEKRQTNAKGLSC